MNKQQLVLLLLSFLAQKTISQNYNFGKLNERHFEVNLTDLQKKASAAILFKNRTSKFTIEDDREGWFVASTHYKVIKVLNNDGLNEGDISVRIYKNDGKEERVFDIKANTYTFTEGILKKTKLNKKDIYVNEINNNWNEVSFAIPDVKVGSIFELSYEVYSPFWKIDDLVYQENVPVLKYHSEVFLPSFFTFNRFKKGYLPSQSNDQYHWKSVNISTSSDGGYGSVSHRSGLANLSFDQLESTLDLTDVPALRKEDFTNNIENYRGSLIYELASYEIEPGNKVQISTDWENVSQQIFDNNHFGKAISDRKFLNAEANRFRQIGTSKSESISKVFEYIKKSMAWNGKNGKFAEKSLKEAFEIGSGNIAEINLNLVALLRQAGFIAYPVLASTKAHGVPSYPTLEGFNYVLAVVFLDDEYILLDASEKLAPPGVLPNRVINWEGLILRKNSTPKKINLFPTIKSRNDILVDATLGADGVIKGKYKQRGTLNEALEMRNDMLLIDKSNLAERKFTEYQLADISNFKIDNTSLDRPFTIGFDFTSDAFVEKIGSKLYVSSTLFLKEKSKILLSEDRLYPIDFEYPKVHRKSVILNIPEGYKVESLPKPVNLTLKEGELSYILNVNVQNGNVQIILEETINTALMRPPSFSNIKKFFEGKMNAENQKIVLIKK
ncbi:DUF3857 domain-containing protein [Dokdonia sp. 4H-3-7-5]|uniref:DUF3857 domain-containing protein n=1 Tax=Dokdonia sp. (strain 4H-3-7-5) TaxID=983548 RepID=UPI00020A69CF|nr:DUF3857 domain-containing protein [Dokdonia sp. 4H-3-7-5]AEE18484.1 hypothetical protein Krodi_0499 [Dokdonia sp. 4H-3-7-5]